ncbi:MAG: diaminopimelate decarboxylase, partial [Oscillospiraceae bacterium]|nr:diaminopimelate decarboxylase [Oscillospiraceae bacterium]
MFVSENLDVNSRGHLTIGGADTVNLAKAFGTPLYVMDEVQIRKHCRSFKGSIDRCYGGKGLVCYASKAFSCKEMYRIIASEGLGVDVVSGGELYTAMETGTDPKKICFHGNNKTVEELKMALSYGVGRIVADNIYEMQTLNALCGGYGKKADILLRIKPGVDAHTHDFIRTGQIDSKFGFALETGEAFEAVKFALECENLNFAGVHCHIGSQILDTQGFEAAAEVMLNFIKKLRDELGAEVRDLNLGGGFGIQYTEKDDPLPYEAFMEAVSVIV